MEYVELTAFDRYGNGTDDVFCNVRPKLTTTPGLTAVVQPPDPRVRGFSKVIYRNGHPVAVECDARTEFYISFGSATAAQVQATSVQLDFSSRRIKPVWTPPVTV